MTAFPERPPSQADYVQAEVKQPDHSKAMADYRDEMGDEIVNQRIESLEQEDPPIYQ